ncbi:MULTISPECIES: endonuclease I family protein [unclassified Streptomyces]|uniref:endonuclease I family protein n=1 Tax=unclassified Streptomyces TaxID=2593676 RepID=UPI0036ED3C1C
MSRRHVPYRRPLLATLAAFAVVAGTAAAAPAALPQAPPAAATPLATLDDTYYQDALGKSGTALKSALHTIISDQTKISYSQVWEALKDTDEDPDNPSNVILLYSGLSESKSNNGGSVGQWNREHVWAKSHGNFGTATGPGTDIHHLRPEDVQVNSIRGNKDFDNGGSAVSGAPGNYTDSDSFEPRDAVKGDVARMILYMAVRYEGDDSFADLEPNEKVSNGSAPNIGRLSVLKEWSQEDPPDSFEQRRNDVIYEQYQHNRNPFIDHPEWVESIW